jgi:hypothetical protein
MRKQSNEIEDGKKTLLPLVVTVTAVLILFRDLNDTF